MQIRPVHTHSHMQRAVKILLAAILLALCAFLIWIFVTPSPVHGLALIAPVCWLGL